MYMWSLSLIGRPSVGVDRSYPPDAFAQTQPVTRDTEHMDLHLPMMRLHGDPVLHRPTVAGTAPQGSALATLIEQMYAVMHDHEGVGLAANQIGRSVRLFVAEYEGRRLVVVDPRIEPQGEPVAGNEGCLSIPGRRFSVPRAPSVRLRGLHPDGSAFSRTFHGHWARIVQHETDHLDGVTIAERGEPVADTGG
jgi:peptide deformylase